MKKLFNNVLSRLSPETLQHIKLVGIVMGVTIVILGGIMLLFGKRDKIAQAFKPGELPPTPTVTPTIIFDKDVLGIQDNQQSTALIPTRSLSVTLTPTKPISTQTPTPTPQSSNPTSTSTPTSTPAPTSSQATPTPTPEQSSLYLSPSSQNVSNGDNLTVELRMNTSENINAVSAKISYPTDKLDFQTIEAVDTFGIQPTEGKASDGIVSIDRGNLSPVTGDKPIVKITFKTKATGSVELQFADGKLLKNVGNTDIVEHKTGGTYTVQ